MGCSEKTGRRWVLREMQRELRPGREPGAGGGRGLQVAQVHCGLEGMGGSGEQTEMGNGGR